jgi:large subunit ribosomal protein L29
MAEKARENIERLRGLTDEELAAELAKVREEQFHQRRRHVTRQLENTAALQNSRRQIARILTLQKERGMAAQGE